MKIKQVVVLAGENHIDCSISSGLEQLGLQMCECFSPQNHGEDCLLVCDQEYVDTSNGSALIRQAMERGCAVLLHNSNCPSVLEEIRSTGEPLPEDKRHAGGSGAVSLPAEGYSRDWPAFSPKQTAYQIIWRLPTRRCRTCAMERTGIRGLLST